MTKCGYYRLITAALTFTVAGLGTADAQNSYLVGYITDLSGPLAESYTPTWEGFELYMKALNDRGGIDGKKVDVVLDDDGLKPDRAVADAKKQAERDNVLGIFGLSLSSTQAPVYAEMRNIRPNGMVVGLTIDSVGGRAALAYNKKVAEAEGYRWDEVRFPVATTDFTPFAQTAVEKKPDIVVGHYGGGQNLGIIPALRRSGYAGPYVIASYGVTEDIVRQAAQRAGGGENIYYVTRYSSAFDNNPSVAEVAAAQKKYKTSKPC